MPVGLPRSFFERPAVDVAPELLGLELEAGDAAVRIVEVEAYEPDDPASHSFIGPRPRTRAMFGPPGHLYVYRSYGIHWCANVVCAADGVGAAVLLRAGEPVRGVGRMAGRRRPGSAPHDLCSGPGKLCAALGVDGSFDGADLCGHGPRFEADTCRVRLVVPDTVPIGTSPVVPAGATRSVPDDAHAARAARRPWWTPAPESVVQTTRIGISKAAERPWRWFERSSPHVSRRAGRGTVR